MEKFSQILRLVFATAELEGKKNMGRFNLVFVGLLFAFALAMHFVDSVKESMCAIAKVPSEPSVGPFFWWTVLIVGLLCPGYVFWTYQKKSK